MVFSTPWSRPVVPGLVCPKPEDTHVQQHFKDECDIHTILRRIEAGADPALLTVRKGFYADLTELPCDSLMDAYDSIAVAEDAFMSLPAEVRLKFDQDPVKFMEYVDKNGPDSVAVLFGEAVPTEPERGNATTNNDDAKPSGGETA